LAWSSTYRLIFGSGSSGFDTLIRGSIIAVSIEPCRLEGVKFWRENAGGGLPKKQTFDKSGMQAEVRNKIRTHF